MSDIATGPDGSRVFVARGTADSDEYTRGKSSLSRTTVAGQGDGVVWAQGGWVLRDSGGALRSVGAGRPTLKFRWSAHRGPIVGLGPLGDDALASVGGDSELRIWAAAPQPLSYPSEGYGGDFTDHTARFGGNRRETVRSMIVADAGTGRLTYSLISPIQAGVVDAGTLAREGKDIWLGDIVAAARPVGDGRVLYLSNAGESALVDIRRRADDWNRKDALLQGLNTGLSAASPDGRRVALATPRKLSAWSASGAVDTVIFDGTDTPVGVMVGNSGPASAVGASGAWYRVGHPPERLELPGGGGAVAAATGPGGDLFVVGKSGTVTRFHDGRPAAVTTVAPSLDVYALRFSPDDRLIALIGGEATEVRDVGTGAVVLVLPRNGDDGSIVRDVALAGGVAWTIRADGSVTRLPVLDDDALVAAMTDDAPRVLTPAERTSVASATRTIGGT